MLIGVLGGGQLGRMLALAGIPLGMRFRFFDEDHGACARAVGELHSASWDDSGAVERFANGCDVVTYEFENVPVSVARTARGVAPVLPSIASLEIGQDREKEKRLFEEVGLPVAPWRVARDPRQLESSVREVGTPCVIKTLRGGYDGKGQRVLRADEAVGETWMMLGQRPLIVERFVAFRREVSVIGVRARDGEFRAYPITQNRHEGGVLRESVAPAPEIDSGLCAGAVAHVRALMERLGHVGVLTVEFFDDGSRLLANELAPRVHNSGHWTIDGAQTSQFENHLRAIAGLPLGSCDARGHSVMVNFIGTTPPLSRLAALAGVGIHLYDKPARAGRKVGHATAVGETARIASERACALIELAQACDKSA